jgi:hypothetical protein
MTDSWSDRRRMIGTRQTDSKSVNGQSIEDQAFAHFAAQRFILID